jgi:membrane protease YdiL (CAAX protease family)
MAVIAIAPIPLQSAAGPSMILVAAAATSEELVFRWILPQYLQRLGEQATATWSRALIAGVVAQMAFAAAHFLPGASRSVNYGFAEGARIAAVGMAYFVVQRLASVATGAALHTALNVSALSV